MTEKKNRTWIIGALLLILLTLNFIWPGSFVADSIKTGFSLILSPIVKLGVGGQNIFLGAITIFEWPSVLAERSRLRNKVEELESLLVEAREAEKENEALRLDLGLENKTKRQTKACYVLGTSAQLRQLSISCGQSAGLQEGFAVVLRGSLIGMVLQVGSLTSTVRLISSSQSALESRVGQANVAGVVRGSFEQGLILDLVPAGSPVVVGDAVVSSGATGKVATGLSIGRVGERISIPGETNQTFVVIPAVSRQDESYVVVVWP